MMQITSNSHTLLDTESLYEVWNSAIKQLSI